MKKFYNNLYKSESEIIDLAYKEAEKITGDHGRWQILDKLFHNWLAKVTLGISPAALSMAYMDWIIHMYLSPGKNIELLEDFYKKYTRLQYYGFENQNPDCDPQQDDFCFKPMPNDRRFLASNWGKFPFNYYCQSFLFVQSWWQDAISGVPGVNKHHQEIVSFMNRQLLDSFSPSNFILSNPVLLEQTLQENGQNLIRGIRYLYEDYKSLLEWKLPEHRKPLKVGVDLAITKGKVIFQNELFELIQYAPKTKKVYAEPVLIIPAWIMKYYILDLTPEKSLVSYLLEQGHSVFIMSWKNPTAEYKNFGLVDYMKKGVLEAMNVVKDISNDHDIHAVGYCLGGTLLSIATAYLNSEKKKNYFKSITLLAAQTDFEEPGELMMFIDESQIAFLEILIKDKGYLSKHQMKGIFQILRSNDLIWSQIIDHYLKGKRTKVDEYLAWSYDSTRMPYKMMIEYLRGLYINNDLSGERFKVDGKKISLKAITQPIFAVATEKDHIAPWKSVYKIHYDTNVDVDFVLTSGGHNVGIVSEINHPKRYYHYMKSEKDDVYLTSDNWQQKSKYHKGSWWKIWHEWLVKKSITKISALKFGGGLSKYKPLYDAPGKYVHED